VRCIMQNSNCTPEKIREALEFIPAHIPRDEWARVGMAIKSEYPDNAGFEIFDDWSQTAPDNYNQASVRDTWRSIQASGGVGVGTLFHLAKTNGFTPAPGARLTPEQLEQQVGERAARALLSKQDRKGQQAQAAKVAAQRWAAATPATDTHPYLAAKGVQAHGVKVEASSLLLVPMHDTAGVLHSLQTIDTQGGKRFLHGGRIRGCYCLIGEPDEALIVCEGFATGASIHQATGHPVAVAFNAGNLQAVALALREKSPEAVLIFAADDDHKTEGNPGLTNATAAARVVDGWLAVPTFPADRPDGATDFNDLAQIAGLEAVLACINTAQPVAADAPQEMPDAGATGHDWPEPTPLPDALPPVAPFDLELLPEALRGWVGDIAHRMQCPVDFVGVGAIAAISSLIGARAVVAPKERDDWRVVPNLWALIVGRPGVMKSPALSEAMKPLHRLESAEREQWQAAHEAWEIDAKVAELAAKQNERQAAAQVAKDPAKARALLAPVGSTEEPTARRYVVNDATVEKLGELLTVNPWGVLVYRDELHGLLCSMDRPGQEGARGFYLTGYDGNQGHAVDRIGRGESYISRVCMAMLGGIQPGKLQSYVRDAVAGGAGDDGLLQRFGLAVWPDINKEFQKVDQYPDAQSKAKAWAVFERLNQLQPATENDSQEWRFSPEAQALYWQWVEPFETELRGDDLHPALISHLSKYRKLVPALALIFALVDTEDSQGVIHERELLRALAWADYLRTHAERIYAAAVIPETAGARQLLDKIRAGKLREGDGASLNTFTPRQVAVKHWAGLGTPDAVRKAGDLLADYGWLVREAVATGTAGGRPSERYLVNPCALIAEGVR
jgi:putative DNA primase/helicase